jgi:GT2 family glycosyltransferase
MPVAERRGPDWVPAVSVIIPTCRRPGLLLDCVASILQNDFDDFEILIVDQDPARTLEEELQGRFPGDGRLVYLFLQEASLSRARNLGIARARGQILVFSDDDTEVAPGWLRAYVDAFDACGPTPAVVGGRLDPIWLAPKPDWVPPKKEYLLGIYNEHDGLIPMPGHILPIGANFAAHRKVVDSVGPFDERLGYSYSRKRGNIGGEDSLFALRARSAGYALYHQAAARAWHKMAATKLTRRYFLRRSFWEGVTLLTVLHLSGSIPADRWHRVLAWHLREMGRLSRRLASTLIRWSRLPHPRQDAMEALCSLAQSAGVMRAAVKLGTSGRLPW